MDSIGKRTGYCGHLGKNNVGEEVILKGWVDTRRDHGGLVFIDLRDREGIVQVVLNPNEKSMEAAKDVRNEFVVALKGKVNARPEGMVNKKISTGEIEVVAESFEIISVAKTPPFQVSDDNVSENLRLKYRYLDLRSDRLQANLKRRHQVTQIVRKFLGDDGFYEIETPILYKSTPEGARDYLVPSRVHLGSFYALPQSPQTLKQLLMVGGYDRYFQIARCFRDEDLRADRQPEFSQIDIEMSFVDQEDVLEINEKLARVIWKEVKGVEIGKIPRMTYHEAMERYGCDKPDIRFSMELKNLNEKLKSCGFKVFEDAVTRGDAIKGLVVPGGGKSSRSFTDKLTDKSKKEGAKGLVWVKWGEDKVQSPVSKFFTEDQLTELVSECGGKKGDMLLIVADGYETTCSVLSALRLHLAKELDLIDTTSDKLLWVTDFPLLEYSPEDKRWVAKHHPFTAPKPEQADVLVRGDNKELGGLLANAYDLVCNGHEIAGGSIRIHREDMQHSMFKALGLSPEEIKMKFGFFIEALSYGTPPHGGVAWGVDRLLMILSGTEAIREVIAFPKTTKAADMMSETPSPVLQDQLLELGVRLAPSVEKGLSEG